MVELSYQILDESINGSDFQITEQNSEVIINGFRAMLVVLLTTAGFAVYVYSVLGDVIDKFRKKSLPKIAGSLAGGLRRYLRLLKVFLASVGRIIAVPMATVILAGMIGSLLRQVPLIQRVLVYVLLAASLILFLVNLLSYGLAPFVHLAGGTAWRFSLATSKGYYHAHRLVVLALFGFVILLPFIFYSLLTKALFNLGVPTKTVSIVIGILPSIVRFFMAGVLINFGMNNFASTIKVPDKEG